MRTSYLFPRRSRLYPVVAGTTAALVAVTLGTTTAVASGQPKHPTVMRRRSPPRMGEHHRRCRTAMDVEERPWHDGQGLDLRRDHPVDPGPRPARAPGQRRARASTTWPTTSPRARTSAASRVATRTGSRWGSSRSARTTISCRSTTIPNSLHGGTVGFDKHIWATTPFRHGSSVGLVMTVHEPGRRPGLPRHPGHAGHLHADQARRIKMNYQATTDQPTIVNLTNHNYWNLAGEGSGAIYGHKLFLNSKTYTPVDPTLIPTGTIDPVAGTPMNFRHATAIGDRIRDGFPQLVIGRGYDHNWVLDRGSNTSASFVAARVTEPTSGRVLIDPHRPARDPVLLRQLPRRHAGWHQRPDVPAGRRVRTRDPALPGLAEPRQLPVDAAAARAALRHDDQLSARHDRTLTSSSRAWLRVPGPGGHTRNACPRPCGARPLRREQR